MIKSYKLFLTTAAICAAALYACSDKNEDPAPGGGSTDKCAGKNITASIDTTPAVKCENNGSFTIHARGSAGFTYQLGGGAFQTDSVFGSLAAGNYSYTVKDADGCTKIGTVSVGETGTKGSNFTSVESLIAAKCNMACHTAGTGGAPKGIFATSCDIVSRRAMIKIKAVDESMGGLNPTEKNIIVTWINAGGKYTD